MTLCERNRQGRVRREGKSGTGPKVRSPLVRALGARVRHRNPADAASLHAETDISGEQMAQIRKVCERIFELEEELRRLRLLVAHLADSEEFELSFAQLAAYGFEPHQLTDTESATTPDGWT